MRLMHTVLLLAAAAVIAPGCAGKFTKYDTPAARLTSLNNCAYGPDSEVCDNTMAKMDISSAEMQTIRTCKWMAPRLALRNADCNAERARFPALFYARSMT